MSESFERDAYRAAVGRMGGAITEVPEVFALAELASARLEQILGGAIGLAKVGKRYPEHPAVLQHAGLTRLSESPDGLTWPEEFRPISLLRGVLLDAMTWAPPSLKEDVFVRLDAETRRWIVPSLRSPEQYEDVMSELYFWGRLQAAGLDIRLIEDDGMPDLLVESDGAGHCCEVKRLRPGTSPKRVNELIKDANRKFKRADAERSGSLFVHVTRPVARTRLDDRIPNDVLSFIEAGEAALHRGQLRSVCELVFTWDELSIAGRFPDPVLYVFLRRVAVITHPESRPMALTLTPNDQLGLTIVSGAQWAAPMNWRTLPAPSTPSQQFDDVVVTEAFRATSEFVDGIRPGHVIEVLKEPDCIVGDRLPNLIDVFIATRYCKLLRIPSILVILAVQRPGEQAVEVQTALHLTGHENELALLRHDAERAFEVLIDRFGMAVRIGTQQAKLVRHFVGPAAIEVDGAQNASVQLFAAQKMLGPDRAEHGYVFCLDLKKYRADQDAMLTAKDALAEPPS